MARFWVVAANVNRSPTTLRRWIATILANRTAYMGWAKDDPKGAVFATIVPGDFVLIAYGSMRKHDAQRRLVACGKVKLNEPTSDPRVRDLRHSQFAQLDPFLPLDEDPADCGISLKDTSHDGNPQPPAVFELRLDGQKHPGNVQLCNWLKRRLSKAPATGKAAVKAASGSVTANTVSTEGEANTEGRQVKTKKQMIVALHRENKLVKEFRQALKKKGRDTTRLRYVAGGNTLYCDVYEPDKRHLIEAKGSATREDIRMAIGQLFDYERLTQQAGKGKSRLAVLLPERPVPGIEQLLTSLKIGVIWKNGRAFSDNCGGALVR
jgi:hypothetical protein